MKPSSVFVAAMLLTAGACGSAGRGTHALAAGATRSTTTTVARTTTTLASTTAVGADRPVGALTMVMAKVSYAPDTLTVKTGKLVLFLANQEQSPASNASFFRHNFVLATNTGTPAAAVVAQSKDIQVGESGVFTIDHLAPGTYGYYCSWHINQQMQGTLTVTA
jgi:plastocyanin